MSMIGKNLGNAIKHNGQIFVHNTHKPNHIYLAPILGTQSQNSNMAIYLKVSASDRPSRYFCHHG